MIESQGRPVVQYGAYEYSDYTQAALEGQLSLAITGQTSTAQYHQRVLGMRRAYQAVGAGSDKEQRKRWPLLSFYPVRLPDEAFEMAQQEAGVRLKGEVHYYRLFKYGETSIPAHDFKLRHVEIEQDIELYMGEDAVLIRQDGAAWQQRDESL
ncbi:hypothetical protein [Pseudomonas sp. 2822-15]|uniref:hypothetical protein n=1 Tax=Pseudomonas sp. 2822-15 TaxID=1712677 RepID=UPI00211433AD|nr:hypothetical protein [Pseudomonas sp. 2822-15]